MRYFLNLIKTGGQKLQKFIDNIWSRILFKTYFIQNFINNAHSGTLEEFSIYELDEKRNSILYHPEINQDIDLLTEYEKEILKIK